MATQHERTMRALKNGLTIDKRALPWMKGWKP